MVVKESDFFFIFFKGLLVNILGAIVILVWSFGNICLLYVVLRYFNLHRASSFDEQIGLDESDHKEKSFSYGDFAETTDQDNSKPGKSNTFLLFFKIRMALQIIIFAAATRLNVSVLRGINQRRQIRPTSVISVLSIE